MKIVFILLENQKLLGGNTKFFDIFSLLIEIKYNILQVPTAKFFVWYLKMKFL